ncbi:ATP-binding protein [Streptomyces sp. ISID311]|uniref:ATP-binding protein n=1 Tax=Streptomyces sp. ISID311 TaxID=2601673 RepID=UPI0011BD315F|nr:ATP-binding protein [Streptomyces sp. ISID311]TXC91729.1 tetratricopeptide repeat protein [Streptomyces sp. ISID311]
MAETICRSLRVGVQVTGRGPSRQELIRRRRRDGLVGRQGEQAAFKDALKQSPEEATQFLFHIHGPAGVGKSTLVRQLESVAREAQALTAYVDEAAADVVEAMEAISAQLAQQGGELKSFDKLLATYRQRRHEADAGAAAGTSGEATASGQGMEAQSPSPSSAIVSQLGLVGLGMIPGVGAFTGALDPNQLAAGADRVKAILSARFRSHEDVQLVLSPLQTLTPVFLQGIAEAAARRPWVVLFFDTYERTGPLWDVWLRDILVSDRYGQLPANVLVVLAGQAQLNARCWGDWLDLVTDLPLEVFTDAEARRLLAVKGITDERITEVILELSGRLPVLVSMLAEGRPGSIAEVGDPSGTAVERFLKWETNPARRAAALACALPQELDEDIYRTVVDDEEAREHFSWLRSLPFVIDRAGRCHYHDVVRTAMLRLQRQQSPLPWQEQHNRLADAFRQRCGQLEDGATSPDSWWEDERWRNYRLQETYHRLCADHRTALPHALRELLDAHDHDITTFRRWAQTLARAGQDANAAALRDWGRQLLSALEGPHPGVATLALLLSRGGLDASGRSHAYILRGWEYRRAGNYPQALADYTSALDQEQTARALRGRGETYRLASRNEEALADFDRAIALEPTIAWAIESRGQTYHAMGRYDEALTDFHHALELDPGHVWALASRGQTYHAMGRYEEALTDFHHALELDPGHVWALASRGQTYHAMGRYEEALTDLDRAIELNPDSAWIIANRGYTYRLAGRYEEAMTDFHRALELDPDSGWIFANRGETHRLASRYEKALADFDRSIELAPDSAWTIASRGQTHCSMGRYEEALADFDRAIELDPDSAWIFANRGETRRLASRYEEARADFHRAIGLDPDYAWALTNRGHTYRSMGRHEKALADYTRAIALSPDSAWIFANRGYAYRLAGQYEEALADLARALELDPENSFAMTNRGVVHRVSGRYEEAMADLSRAIGLDPENAWIHYETAVALHAVQDPGAPTHLMRVVELCTPDHSELSRAAVADIGNLFLAHCVTSDWAKAEQYLAAFMSSSPAPGEIAELLTAMNTLEHVVASAEGHLPPFRTRLEGALGEC